MRTRVLAAVEACDYKPDLLAASLRQGATRTIGVVVSDIVNPLFAEIVEGLEERLRGQGYCVVLTHSHGDPSRDVESIELLRQRRVDGLVLSVADETQPRLVELLRNLDVPVVLLDRDIAGWEQASAVLSDHRDGVAQITGQLLDGGHTRVALITGSDHTRPGRQRQAGFLDAFRTRGTDSDPTLVRTGPMSVAFGMEAAEDLFADTSHPSAVIVGANLQLVGLLRVLKHRGLSVGTDVAIAACDDVPTAALHTPPITVIARDTRKLGRDAAELLLERLDDPVAAARTTHLPTQVVSRPSTRMTVGAG